MLTLLIFEIKSRILKISTMIYFLFFFLISFLFALIDTGAFPGIIYDLLGKPAINSPYALTMSINKMSVVAFIILGPIFGNSINRDYENNFWQIFFSCPIGKVKYFLIKYFGSIISSIIIFSSLALGIWIASLLPFTNKQLVESNHLVNYVYPYLIAVIPNIFILGAFFIAVASYFKKMSQVYFFNIILVVIYLIAEINLHDMDSRLFGSLLDPFGVIAMKYKTQYWTLLEMKSRFVPFAGIVCINRIIWLFISQIVLCIFAFVFKPLKKMKEKAIKQSKIILSDSRYNLELKMNSVKGLFQMAFFEFKQAFFNIYFIIMLLMGIAFIVIDLSQLGKIYGVELQPVTYHILEGLMGSFKLFVTIMLTYYSGELIWKDKELSFSEIVDVTPVSNLFLYLSKLIGLFFLLIFFAFIMFLAGIFIQISSGYYNFELSLYVKYLFLQLILSKLFLCVFILLAHTVARKKFIGHSISILYYAITSMLPILGMGNRLYILGDLPNLIYSDMNGFGGKLQPYFAFSLYWGIVYLFLGFITIMLWKRCFCVSWKKRLVTIKINIIKNKSKLLLAFCIWMIVGGYIFYNTSILNGHKKNDYTIANAVQYEKKYKNYEKENFPEIKGAKLEVDIYPEKKQIHCEGTFKYQNSLQQPISRLMLTVPDDVKIYKLKWSKEVNLIEKDDKLNVYVYDLQNSLKTNESLELFFEIEVYNRGFQENVFSTKVVGNGTFFCGREIFPSIGYDPLRELDNDSTRRKYMLPVKAKKKTLDKTYISHEGSWIDFEAIVSTSSDQIAITSGKIVNSWQKDGRNFYHYQNSRPILNFYAFLSAKYSVVKDRWNNIDIEIYYHSKHVKNIQRMINAIKRSLKYYTQNFSPYQFSQLRIVEFPRYLTAAQSLPNTIPYSEGIGFIANVKENDTSKIDYVFYVVAHEIAHQWWAHQVIGANVAGYAMLSESLAQYSALMVQEKEYGPSQMKKFLEFEMDLYFLNRKLEKKVELPLMYTENQAYVYYNKASIVFYYLKSLIGEENLNEILRQYIKDYAFQNAPFNKSQDLVERLKKQVPENEKYIIEELFEKVIVYDNSVKKAAFIKENDSYNVQVEAEIKKYLLDENGLENELKAEEFIDIGVFDSKNELIYLQKHKIQSGSNSISFSLKQKPYKIEIDPDLKLIDKNFKKHTKIFYENQ